MIDPNNVLIRCPNGHELQAAKTDLDKALACPVCNVTFTPAVGPVSEDATAAGADGGVAAVDYADATLTSPITYPAYTNWMLGLWLAVFILNAVVGLYKLASTPTVDQTAPSGGVSMLGGVFACFSMLAFAAVVVLQLMWIYRIHKDARRARNYQSVSPGLALGLSFIPVFNFTWTAWAMKRLATFVTDEERRDDPAACQAAKATNLCLIAGIALALAYCLTFSLFSTTWIEVFREARAQGIDRQAMQARLEQSIPLAWQVISPLISVTCVLLYFWAVRSLEAVLYPFLGAQNR